MSSNGNDKDSGLSRPDASDYPRVKTIAVPQNAWTSLGQAIQVQAEANSGKSGFHFLATGTESLKQRLALIQGAEKSIDLQYYTIHDDVSANLLLEAILRAAQRNVRVRFLIDNISMGEVGKSLGVLDGVKNIEIRVFNPSSTRHQSYFSRIMGSISDFSKLYKRMHNKALIADNQLSIIGGRNLGDEYFEAHSDSNFKDADLLSAGPITAKISHSFDAYWNSENTFPINSLRKPPHSGEEIEKLRAQLKKHWEKELQTKDGQQLLKSNFIQLLEKGEVKLIWAEAELCADSPEKVDEKAADALSVPLYRLQQMTAKAKNEVIIVSPYFVPQDDGVRWLCDLVKRGVSVKILTNSLASTDVVAVHTGYRRYREALLKGGVELYEFKPVGSGKPRQRLFGGTAPATASLHAKMYIVDRASVLIGSFNLDPRSALLNTEIAIAIHHEKIAGQMRNMFQEAISPASSYQLSLHDQNKLYWETKEKGAAVTYRHDPEAVLRKIEAFFMGLLPVENQL